jgi:hypothetical protein
MWVLVWSARVMIGGRYQVERELGAGTSGTVYAAIDVTLGRAVALKVLHPAIAARDDARRRFVREAKIAAQLVHPGAAQVYEVGESEQGPFLAMELMSGQTLERALEAAGKEPCSVPSMRAIGAALAEVLAAAHAIGVVHRDVKPGNVFLTGDLAQPGRVRLVDFGLAFMVAPSSESLGRITVEGDLLGTPAYMSPEQCEAQEVGPPSDVYALGCLLYELVTGRPPFVGNLARIIAGHVYLPHIPIGERDLARPVPADLAELVHQMLDKDPARRPTAEASAVALRDDGGAISGRGALGTRAERSVAALGDAAARTPPRVRRVALPSGADPVGELAAALRHEGLEVVELDGAEVALVYIDDHGAPIAAPAGATVVGLHAAPTPAMLAAAIRAGVATVTRWPAAPTALAARLRAVRVRRDHARGADPEAPQR